MADNTPLSEVTQVRKADLCRVLGISDESVSNYVKLGMPVTGKGHGARYNLSECIQWVRAYEVKKAVNSTKGPGSDSEETLKLRLLTAKVQQEEYEAAKVMGAMVTIDDFEKALSRELERVRVKLLAIPAVWAPQLLGMKEIPDTVDRLNDLVTALMDELQTEPTDDGDSEDVDLDAEPV